MVASSEKCIVVACLQCGESKNVRVSSVRDGRRFCSMACVWAWRKANGVLLPYQVQAATDRLIKAIDPSHQPKRQVSSYMRKRVAEANKQREITPATRKKMSFARRGKKLTKEHRDKIATSHIGIRPTDKTRAKLRAARARPRQSYKHSEASKRKISIANKGKPRSDEYRDAIRQTLLRRHEQVYEAIKIAIKDNPRFSDKAIAKIVGCHIRTVSRVRKRHFPRTGKLAIGIPK